MTSSGSRVDGREQRGDAVGGGRNQGKAVGPAPSDRLLMELEGVGRDLVLGGGASGGGHAVRAAVELVDHVIADLALDRFGLEPADRVGNDDPLERGQPALLRLKLGGGR